MWWLFICNCIWSTSYYWSSRDMSFSICHTNSCNYMQSCTSTSQLLSQLRHMASCPWSIVSLRSHVEPVSTISHGYSWGSHPLPTAMYDWRLHCRWIYSSLQNASLPFSHRWSLGFGSIKIQVSSLPLHSLSITETNSRSLIHFASYTSFFSNFFLPSCTSWKFQQPDYLSLPVFAGIQTSLLLRLYSFRADWHCSIA